MVHPYKPSTSAQTLGVALIRTELHQVVLGQVLQVARLHAHEIVDLVCGERQEW